jgi:autotransporter translocation and assembly factor TamB
MIRRLSRGLKIFALLLLLLAVLYGLLQTAPVKSVIAAVVSRALSLSGEMEVRIGRISGRVPGNIRLDTLEIGDDQGIWLSAENLHCRWSIRALLRGHVRLRRLGADVIEIHHWPSFPAREKERKVPVLRTIKLDGLNVEQLKLGNRLAGMPLEYVVRSGGISFEQGRLTGGIAIGGDAEGWVDFDTLVTDIADNRIKLSAKLQKMNKPTFGLDHISGSAEATIDARGVAAVIDARMEEKGQTGNLSARLHYAAGNLELQQFRLEGPKSSINGDVSFAFSKNLIDVSLNAGFVDSYTNRFALNGTASLAVSNKIWSLDIRNLDVSGWDAAACSVSGMVSKDRMDLQGELYPFEINGLPLKGLSGLTGKMSGRFAITGALNDPQVDADFDVLQVGSRKDHFDELPKVDFRIAGGLADGRLFAASSMTNSNYGFLSTELAMPADVSLSPLRFRLRPQEISGHLDADLDIGIINGLAFMRRQHVQGKLTARLTRENQLMAGSVKLEQGGYEHYAWGILVRAFSGELEATTDGFTIRNATASGEKSGKIELSGHMENGVLDAQLDLTGAHVVRRPEIAAAVSGRLKVAGPWSRPMISGRLEVDRADILPDNVVLQKTVMLTDYDVRPADRTAVNQPRKPMRFGWDVQVDMPDQIYVNAALIDSVWGGAVKVKDTPAGLSISGQIAPQRGFVSFIGKKFRFEQGKILFSGVVPLQPVYDDLTAEYARGDFTARLILNGGVSDPQFRMESNPALPEDEILSQVMFGRDTSSISTYQAIQLAAAAKQLSGGLSGPGFMYSFRQAVGIDTLEWRESAVEGDSSSVAAGKYIGSALYVEVDSEVESEGGTHMTAEYEINRHFSVETSVGPRMRPGIGVSWKNDY